MNDLFSQTDEAIQRADDHADEEWKTRYYATVLACAAMWPEFTTSEITAQYERTAGPQTHELRAIGAIIRRAIKDGIIERTDNWVPTGSHGRPQRVWRSLIYRSDW